MAGKRGANGAAVADGSKVSGSLPLYADPQAINSATHRDVSIDISPDNFAFAASAPLIQITVDEFERAALDYPIVFFGADRQPYVVTGLELDRNLFIKDGSYRSGAYIPAYLRRYPFVFARDENSENFVLCLDHSSDRVTTSGKEDAEPLFDGDSPSALTQQALQFCENYEGATRRTTAFLDLLVDLDLLEPRQAHYTAPGATAPTLLLEYLTVDRAKLDRVDGEGLTKLREMGALAACYAVAASQMQWEVLPLLGV